jgi:signal transduction histidine kinase
MKVASVSIDNARHVEELLRNERIASLGKMSNLLIEDIKKPILISKRYTEHLLKKDLEKDIYNILEMMLEQLEGVGDVVQSVSSYSEGKTMLRNVNVNLNELLNDFTQRIKYFVENKNCKIENDLSTDVSVSIDIREFYQVFDKIVKNAVESMPEGGKVTVSTEVKEDYVNINFQDEGVGIPEEVINKVYEPFMSYGKSMNTGLGLSIAKKIVAAHNGELKIESETGKGTKVQIVLPVADEF